jgi:toxin-antitoxin system PIN domain toxin
MIVAADTNLFLYAANPASPHYNRARRFFEDQGRSKQRFLLCGLVLVELYMQLRNPAVFKKPKTAREATAFCDALRSNPAWEFGDYEPEVAKPLWNWAAKTKTGFRHIIDARLAFTLRYHGVTHFATANPKHFEEFEFAKVWSPISSPASP